MHSAVSPRPATLTKADMPTIDFWYEFASTYSYPTAMRIENMAADGGIDVRWRPFLLGPIFKAFGWNDSPFNIFAAKGRYMWRDLERLCEADGLPLKLPPVRFPQNGLKAARLALVGEAEGWIQAFTRAVSIALSASTPISTKIARRTGSSEMSFCSA